jgi:cytochrome P450
MCLQDRATALSLPSFPFDMGPYGSATLAYDAFRTRTPVCRILVPSGLEVWLITRYADVCMVHRDPTFSREEAVRAGAALVKEAGMEIEAGVLQNIDGERHTRLRKVFASHYMQNQTSRWTHVIRAEAHEVIDTLKPNTVFDLRVNFFEPVAQRSAETIFGFPIKPDYRILDLFFDAAKLSDLQKRYASAVSDSSIHATSESMYFETLKSACRDGVIDEADLIMNLIVFTIVTFDAIGGPFLGGLFALLRDHDQWEACVQKRQLLPNAVNEMLRCYPNGDGQFLRVALSDVILSGVKISQGDIVLAPVSAANVDPDVFPDPRRFDVRRSNSDKHVAFGVGRHHCIGSFLVAVWMRAALEALLDRLPSLRLAVPPEAIQYQSVPLINTMDQLPVIY